LSTTQLDQSHQAAFGIALKLRSLLFFIGFWAIIGVFTLVTCLLAFLPAPRLQAIAARGNQAILLWLELTCNIVVEFEGLENVPSEPTVFLSNHQSTFETFCLQRELRPVSTVVKKSLLFIPFFGWTLHLIHPIAIDRASPKAAMKQVLQRGMTRLEEGYNVIIYPEGTRLRHGESGPFARSGAALGIKAHAPVVPVAHNAGRCWPHQFVKYPGKICVAFGPAIRHETNSKHLTEQVQQWIEARLSDM
jgi:1-acyl-sn-glycerol-3-phosphate acyltransferase